MGRGRQPRGAAGLGARLGQKLRGYNPDAQPAPKGGCGCGGCGRSGVMMMGLSALVASVMGMSKVAPATAGSPAARVASRFVRSYQANVAAHRGVDVCNYTPSCSAYGLEAVERHGAVRGTAMAAARVARCDGRHGGYDPVR